MFSGPVRAPITGPAANPGCGQIGAFAVSCLFVVADAGQEDGGLQTGLEIDGMGAFGEHAPPRRARKTQHPPATIHNADLSSPPAETGQLCDDALFSPA